MGATTPGGPGRGGMPPMEGGPAPIPPGIRPPKDDGRPGIRPPRPPKEAIFPIAGEPPKGGKGPEIFDKLLEGIKKTGKPFGGRGGKPVVSRPAPGSDIPLGPDDRPLDPSDILNPPRPKIVMGPDDRPVEVWPWGREDDPDYDRKKKEYFEKKMGPMPKPKPEPFGTGPRPPRPFEMREPDFMSGPGRGRPPIGTKKEAVVFGGKPSSTGSKRPTKGSPKGGMTKAGPVDAEAKNKFEEMLAYMKRFQK